MAKQLSLCQVTLKTLVCILGVSFLIELSSMKALSSDSRSLAATLSSEFISDDEKIDFLSVRELYTKGNYQEALQKADEFKSKHTKTSLIGQIENLTGLCYLSLKQPGTAISHFTQALENASTPSDNTPFLQYNLARAQYEAGHLDDARETISRVHTESFDPENLSKYEQLKLTLGEVRPKEPELPVNSMAIGVLLPLKGKFSQFGEHALQGIELAFNIFDTSKPDPKITLVIEDSGDQPEQAIKAFNRLVERHHVVAVIGPLLAKGIDQITRRAQELKVPLLSLSKQTGSTAEYVIPAGMTFQMQAYEIARHAIQKMNIHRFAILSPKDKVGEEFTNSFWDAVESLGGTITGAESYSPGETDFRSVVDKLSGLYYTEARQAELNELARLRTQNQIHKRTRKTEQYYSLKPIVDYDAVFIPDEPKVTGQILPTFAYRDVENIYFLGPSAWNSQELISRGQTSAEKAIFVDALFTESQSPSVQRFIQEFHQTFDSDPTAVDALAYDATKVLNRALSSTSPDRSRKDLLEHIKDIKNEEGVTGKISFRDGQLYRELEILTVNEGKIVEYKNTRKTE